MTKTEMLNLLRLLSALESALIILGKDTPAYLYDQITEASNTLIREILK